MAFKTDVEGRWPYSWDERTKVLELDFPEVEYEERLQRLYVKLTAQDLDVAVVYGGPNNDANVRYLTGWVSMIGDSFVIVSTKKPPILVTNSIFHGEPMHSNIQTCWIRDFRPLSAPGTVINAMSLVEAVAQAVLEIAPNPKRIGFIGGPRFPIRFDREIREALSRSELVECSAMLASLRSIKSPREIALIRELGRATTAGMEAALDIAIPGRTESDLSAVAQQAMVAHGCEFIPFGPKCQSGTRSAMKNVFPLPGKKIEEGEIVSIDIQGQMKGYISDHARSTIAGRGTPDQIRLLQACAEAEDAGIRATAAGVRIGDVVEAMSAVIAKRGFADWDWSVGHGFGLELVEFPYVVKGSNARFEAGNTFFIEPMIVPTHMGCSCFEDSILVTENGAERLTTSRVQTWLEV